MIVSLNQLGNVLSRWGHTPVACPHCSRVMPFKFFHRRHVKRVHGIDTTRSCPFCVRFEWPKDKKARPEHVLHRLECAKTFLKRQTVPQPFETTERDDDVCETCAAFDSRSYRRLYFPSDSADVPPQSVLENEAFFDGYDERQVVDCSNESGLGRLVPVALAAFFDYDWYHVPVSNLNRFVDHFGNAYLDSALTALPFWCVCGSGYRHVILACEKGLLLNWPDATPIDSQFQLAVWIDRVGRPRTDCGTPHSWINRPVYPHALMGMCALFEGGLQSLLTVRCGGVDVTRWHDRVTRDSNGWVIPVRHTGQVPSWNCVLPVRWDLEPTGADDANRIAYVPGLRLWFRRNPYPAMGDWHAYQKRLGNVLMETMLDRLYVLSPSQQRAVDELIDLKMDWNVKWLEAVQGLEAERNRYMAKYDALLCENSSLEKQLVDALETKRR